MPNFDTQQQKQNRVDFNDEKFATLYHDGGSSSATL
jgi:hypothetical protein